MRKLKKKKELLKKHRGNKRTSEAGRGQTRKAAKPGCDVDRFDSPSTGKGGGSKGNAASSLQVNRKRCGNERGGIGWKSERPESQGQRSPRQLTHPRRVGDSPGPVQKRRSTSNEKGRAGEKGNCLDRGHRIFNQGGGISRSAERGQTATRGTGNNTDNSTKTLA